MALTSEIDALLAAGVAQGKTLTDVLQELQARYGQEEYADDLVAISGSFSHSYATGSFADIRAYLADTDITMPLDTAWERTWGACMDNDLNMVCHYACQMIRVMGRDRLFIPGSPTFAMKSKTWGGKAWFSF